MRVLKNFAMAAVAGSVAFAPVAANAANASKLSVAPARAVSKQANTNELAGGGVIVALLAAAAVVAGIVVVADSDSDSDSN